MTENLEAPEVGVAWPKKALSGSYALKHALGGSWVVISGVRSPLIWVISIVTLLITLLIATYVPPSSVCYPGAPHYGWTTMYHKADFLLQGLYMRSLHRNP